MKRKAVEEVDEAKAAKKQVRSCKAPCDFKSYFRKGLFELEDQKKQYADSQP